MEPIVLIHGYSAESKESTVPAITGIYGTLPDELRAIYGSQGVVEIFLSRYVSLSDGLSLDDVSRALHRALTNDFPALLQGRFHVIIHSTGALVVRNWIRRFSPTPSPIRNLVYLAGANFGSGWAHIGKGQLAKWSRKVFQDGADRGLQVLSALELGSSWTLDLHLDFVRPGRRMQERGVQEYVVIGTQADISWFELPIRYSHEDGSDGVVRTAASNLNFQYARFEPTEEALGLSWNDVLAERDKHFDDEKGKKNLYRIVETSCPGQGGRGEIPFAIPFQCAHSGEDLGIVTGRRPRRQVLRLIQQALETPQSPEAWTARLADFRQATEATYENARKLEPPAWWKKWVQAAQAQYDHHAMVVIRIRDQDGRPVKSFDVFFDSVQSRNDPSLPIGELIEDKHINGDSPNVIVFYLRTDAWDAKKKDWIARVPQVRGAFLEITAVEPASSDVVYLPMRFKFSAETLAQWIRGHHTTVMDVTLLRVPGPNVYQLVKLP
jgi:hypothetical protein